MRVELRGGVWLILGAVMAACAGPGLGTQTGADGAPITPSVGVVFARMELPEGFRLVWVEPRVDGASERARDRRKLVGQHEVGVLLRFIDPRRKVLTYEAGVPLDVDRQELKVIVRPKENATPADPLDIVVSPSDRPPSGLPPEGKRTEVDISWVERGYPVVPERLIRARAQGTTNVRHCASADGVTESVALVALFEPDWHASVIDALMRSRIEATVDGRRRVPICQIFRFNLEFR